MEEIILDLIISSEYSQRELARYRELGTVQSLRRIKRQEQRRRHRLQVARKILEVVFFTLCMLFTLWVFASWVDVVMHNTYPNPVYQPWNLINIHF